MRITTKLKERFCKDCNIPINIFQEPYFTDRLKLYDEYYGTIDKWNTFVNELNKYKTEQDYFEEYNRVKDEAINAIKSSEAYEMFQEEDMNQYAITYKNLPGKDIYHPINAEKSFISIDMKHANFSSLQHYGNIMSKSMFSGASTWEEFIGLFTNNKHIINSKYIRQVILGNCNPKRHITYEKYLMNLTLDCLINGEAIFSLDRVVFFSNDEIIIDVTDLNDFEQIAMWHCINKFASKQILPLKAELFILCKIDGTDGYYKWIYEEGFNKIKFKCLDSLYMPFVIRHFKGEEVTEFDKVFYHNGLLAKFIEEPHIKTN